MDFIRSRVGDNCASVVLDFLAGSRDHWKARFQSTLDGLVAGLTMTCVEGKVWPIIMTEERRGLVWTVNQYPSLWPLFHRRFRCHRCGRGHATTLKTLSHRKQRTRKARRRKPRKNR